MDSSIGPWDTDLGHGARPPAAEVGLAIGIRHELGDRDWGAVPVDQSPEVARHLYVGRVWRGCPETASDWAALVVLRRTVSGLPSPRSLVLTITSARRRALSPVVSRLNDGDRL